MTFCNTAQLYFSLHFLRSEFTYEEKTPAVKGNRWKSDCNHIQTKNQMRNKEYCISVHFLTTCNLQWSTLCCTFVKKWWRRFIGWLWRFFKSKCKDQFCKGNSLDHKFRKMKCKPNHYLQVNNVLISMQMTRIRLILSKSQNKH